MLHVKLKSKHYFLGGAVDGKSLKGEKKKKKKRMMEYSHQVFELDTNKFVFHVKDSVYLLHGWFDPSYHCNLPDVPFERLDVDVLDEEAVPFSCYQVPTPPLYKFWMGHGRNMPFDFLITSHFVIDDKLLLLCEGDCDLLTFTPNIIAHVGAGVDAGVVVTGSVDAGVVGRDTGVVDVDAGIVVTGTGAGVDTGVVGTGTDGVVVNLGVGVALAFVAAASAYAAKSFAASTYTFVFALAFLAFAALFAFASAAIATAPAFASAGAQNALFHTFCSAITAYAAYASSSAVSASALVFAAVFAYAAFDAFTSAASTFVAAFASAFSSASTSPPAPAPAPLPLPAPGPAPADAPAYANAGEWSFSNYYAVADSFYKLTGTIPKTGLYLPEFCFPNLYPDGLDSLGVLLSLQSSIIEDECSADLDLDIGYFLTYRIYAYAISKTKFQPKFSQQLDDEVFSDILPGRTQNPLHLKTVSHHLLDLGKGDLLGTQNQSRRNI
ncbi:hypothetical protein RIF29_28183 [Crotalaria pallida]|uniref:Uncharacterized protein n=1 Tax=Crotalaria pallida TaxID=3830 RepID=A0AAN9ESN5_CROPI